MLFKYLQAERPSMQIHFYYGEFKTQTRVIIQLDCISGSTGSTGIAMHAKQWAFIGI